MHKEERFVWVHSPEGSSSWSDRPSKCFEPLADKVNGKAWSKGQTKLLSSWPQGKGEEEEAEVPQLCTGLHFIKVLPFFNSASL